MRHLHQFFSVKLEGPAINLVVVQISREVKGPLSCTGEGRYPDRKVDRDDWVDSGLRRNDKNQTESPPYISRCRHTFALCVYFN